MSNLKSIAVVEDDASLRALENLIGARGLDVHGFANAEAFLAQRDSVEIDCLITDVQMDGMGGVELFDILRKAGDTTPVIFITAFEDERIHRQVMAAGATAYFKKRFDCEEVIECIEKEAAKLDGYDGLHSIKGIGPRSAAVLLTSIGNVNDFESANKLAAYLGIVPRVSQSNDIDNRGRITKRGDNLARTTLVQCTLIAIRYSGYLSSYYRRIKVRRGAGKAIIATTRKLLSIIYDTLKNGWVFEDFPHFKIAEKSTPSRQSS